jgi:hypothetical protein
MPRLSMAISQKRAEHIFFYVYRSHLCNQLDDKIRTKYNYMSDNTFNLLWGINSTLLIYSLSRTKRTLCFAAFALLISG